MSPRFNHVAMSVPADLLDRDSAAEIVQFHRDVFGWDEMPTMTIPRERLVLQAYTYEQFVFLIAEDEPMRCPRLDHFGMSVESKDELDRFLANARAAAAADDRVDLIDAEVEAFGDGSDGPDGPGYFLKLHNFYVSFLLPMMIEVQFYEWIDDAGNDR
jgi:hypothetical protein